MIEPTDEDIGRRVFYSVAGAQKVSGTLDRFTEHYCFVTFDVWDAKKRVWLRGDVSSPTSASELRWKDGGS